MPSILSALLSGVFPLPPFRTAFYFISITYACTSINKCPWMSTSFSSAFMNLNFFSPFCLLSLWRLSPCAKPILLARIIYLLRRQGLTMLSRPALNLNLNLDPPASASQVPKLKMYTNMPSYNYIFFSFQTVFHRDESYLSYQKIFFPLPF